MSKIIGASQDTQYQGSLAFNQFLPSNESVNSGTGSLVIAETLINLKGINETIGLSVNIMYAANSLGILGLPSGWTFNIGYIIGNSLTGQGKTYIIDPKWSDSTGYQSGLRYANSHGLKFETIIPPQPLPSGRPGTYAYKMSYEDGSHDYFDSTGKLLEHDDRYNNYINYYYVSPYSGVIGNYLEKIVDSYGQVIYFSYESNSIIVTLPNSGKTKIYYSTRGVEYIVDALGYQTQFNYTNQSNKIVLNDIKYPTGLNTRVGYTSIAYKTSNGTQYFPAVSELLHLDSNQNVLDSTSYTYGYATGGNTFTGYKAGYILSSSNDGLMESNNMAYRYDVLIRKLDKDGNVLTASALYYNYLHLPVETAQYEVKNGTASGGYKTLYTYEVSTDWHARTANYNKPITVEQLVSSKEGNEFFSLSKVMNSYDLYGNLRTSEQSLYDNVQGAFLPQKKDTNTYVVTSWGGEMPESVTSEDLILGSSKKTTYILTEDQKNIHAQFLEYSSKEDSIWKPWKTKTWSYDSQGRVLSSTLEWSKGSQHDPNSISSTTQTYKYVYDSANRTLKIITTDAIGSNITRIYNQDLPQAPLKQMISPLGEVITYEYDILGRLRKKIDAEGYVSSLDYQLASKEGKNSITDTNPMGYIIVREYDALGRTIKEMDNGDPTQDYSQAVNRILSQTTYTNVGQVASVINILGLASVYEYDSFERQIQEIDPLGNVKTIEYDNTKLTTVLKLNQVLKSTIQKDGLGRILTTNTYPDPDDKQLDYYIQETGQYGGFGQLKEKNLYQIDKATDRVISQLDHASFTYNPDGKAVKGLFVGYKDSEVQLYKNNVYDLLGETLYSTRKTIYIDGRTYTNNSDKLKFNEVGELISRTNALGQIESYTYDSDGRLYTLTRFDGTTFTYAYDKNSNLITKSWKGGIITNTYYENNARKSVSDGTTTLKYEYYLDGNLKTILYPDKQQTYQLDQYSRMISQIDASDFITSYTYNDNGLLDTTQRGEDKFYYTYATINHTKEILAHTHLSGNRTLKYDYQYNGFGRISTVQTTDEKENTLLNTHYSYDSLGRLKNLKEDSVTNLSVSVNFLKTFSYDGLSQVITSDIAYNDKEYSGKNTSYIYDGNHNVLSQREGDKTKNYEYNLIDQLQSPDIDYDTNGRMTEDGSGYLYVYNELDQIMQVTTPDGFSLINYTYYPDGLLATRLENNNNQQFYYDNGVVNAISCNAIDSDNKTWTNFLFNGRDRVVAYTKDQSPFYYLISNGSTSQILVGDTSVGLEYEAYGVLQENIAKSYTAKADKNFMWNQEYADSTTNLVYLRSRFYNPKLKRFMSMDTYPVNNKYSFGEGDPINLMDPSGHLSVPQVVLDSIGIAVGVISAIAAPFTGGSSLAIGAAVTSGVLGAASSAAALAANVTGNKGAEIASWVLMGVGGALDLASLGVNAASKVASRTAREIGPVAQISRQEALLRSGPIFVGETHSSQASSNFIGDLINRGGVRALSMEVPSAYNKKPVLGPLTARAQMAEGDYAIVLGKLNDNWKVRYKHLIGQAIDNNIPVYFHDEPYTALHARGGGGSDVDIIRRNGFSRGRIQNAINDVGENGRGLVVLGGADHFVDPTNAGLNVRTALHTGINPDYETRFFNISN